MISRWMQLMLDDSHLNMIAKWHIKYLCTPAFFNPSLLLGEVTFEISWGEAERAAHVNSLRSTCVPALYRTNQSPEVVLLQLPNYLTD